MSYQKEFQNIFFSLQDSLSHDKWMELYQKPIYWELQLDKAGGSGMKEVFQSQKNEANVEFCKFVDKQYLNWVGKPEKTAQIHVSQFAGATCIPAPWNQVFRFFSILIDNLRFDSVPDH